VGAPRHPSRRPRGRRRAARRSAARLPEGGGDPLRTLSARELNRALLARQLLLRRSRAPLIRALERIGGLQAQYAPSAYVGLWTRLDGFRLADLTRALEQERAVQGTLLRGTIHVVSRADYWPFAEAIRRDRRELWLRGHARVLADLDLDRATRLARKALAEGTRRRDELVALVGGTVAWNGVDLDLLRMPPSGTWEHRRADLYATAESRLGPPQVSEADALDHVLRRYLAAFGPATLADAASWAGVKPATLRPAAERLTLRTFADESGATLLDLPRAPLPGDVPAPVRFLPTWDATLLVHARRSQILPERFRTLLFDPKTPHSLPSFLVDGAVAGTWRTDAARRSARIELTPFEGVPRSARPELRDEAGRLLRLVEPDASSYEVRGL
jgi:hypothetical protein